MEGLAIHLVIGLICGSIASAIAASKGRNAVGWFFGGFFIGLIGIIIVACLGNLKEQRAYQRRIESEAHRLREQLRLERIKGEAYRQHTAERLDTHDQALGMDTRSTTALPGGRLPGQLPGAAPPVEDPAAALQQMAGGNTPQRSGYRHSEYAPPAGPGSVAEGTGPPWYYERGGNSIGPVSQAEVCRLIRTGAIAGSTLLWTEGMADWQPLRAVAALRAEIGP